MQPVRVQYFSLRLFDTDGISGFDYDFNSIENDTNELFCAYREMFELAISQQRSPARQVLGVYFPIINVLFVSEYHRIAVHFVLIGDNLAGRGSEDS